MNFPPPEYSKDPASLYFIHGPNGCVYVGITVHPTRRWRQHMSGRGSPRLRHDVALHDVGAFSLEVVGWFSTWEGARHAERDDVDHLRSEGASLYNGMRGGGGGVMPNGGGLRARFFAAQSARSSPAANSAAGTSTPVK